MSIISTHCQCKSKKGRHTVFTQFVHQIKRRDSCCGVILKGRTEEKTVRKLTAKHTILHLRILWRSILYFWIPTTHLRIGQKFVVRGRFYVIRNFSERTGARGRIRQGRDVIRLIRQQTRMTQVWKRLS